MKTFATVLAAILCGVSFHLGVKHGRGELTPAVEAKLRALRDWFISKLPARVQEFLK